MRLFAQPRRWAFCWLMKHAKNTRQTLTMNPTDQPVFIGSFKDAKYRFVISRLSRMRVSSDDLSTFGSKQVIAMPAFIGAGSRDWTDTLSLENWCPTIRRFRQIRLFPAAPEKEVIHDAYIEDIGGCGRIRTHGAFAHWFSRPAP